MQFVKAAFFVGAVNAAAYGYPQNNSSSTPEPYPTTPAGYPVSSPVDVYVTTKTVETLVTICPGPTTVVQGKKTYTVTESTTLTIIDCPCTYVETIPASAIPTPTGTIIASHVPEKIKTISASVYHPVESITASEYGPIPTPAPVYPTGSNATVPHPSGTGSAPPTEFTGAAAQIGLSFLAVAAAGAALL